MNSPFSSRLLAALLASGTVLSVPAWAQTPPSSVDPGQLQRRLQEPRLPHTTTEIAIPGTPEEGLTDASDEKVFTLQSVMLDGGSVYKTEDFSAIYGEYVGKQVSFADLRRIASRMTTQYRNDGYILSRVIVPPQKVNDGKVRLQAIEGFIDNVQFEGEIKGDRKLLDAYASKITAARPITSKMLERYMLLMDDLPGVTARSVIRPSATTPQAASLIVTLDHEMVEGDVSFDNRGNRFLGPYQIGAVAAINSGLGMYERNTFRVLNSIQFDELHYGEFGHESQIGTEGTRLNFRASAALTNPGGRLEPLDIEGESYLAEMGFQHPHIRSREENLESFASLRVQNVSTDILNTDLFDDRLRVVSAGLNYDRADSYDGVNQLGASVSQGLTFLGATDDGAGRSRLTGENNFTLFNARLSRLQNLSEKWAVLFASGGQYTSDSLLSSEQFPLGGAAFGRAYDGAEITGDSGVSGAIELRYAGFPASDWLLSYQPYAFYDIGTVWTNDPVVGEENRESLASAGLGVRFNLTNQVSGGVEVAVPLTRDVVSELDDDPRVFFNLLKRF